MSSTAHIYDLFYDGTGKDYAAEAVTVLEAIEQAGASPRTLLDVACGTGRHIEVFQEHGVACQGLDLDAEMLDVARRRCPEVPFHHDDMVDFDLDERFDAVTCLFSSIGYVGTVDRLRQTLRSMARHLEPDGVVVVEPWLQPEVWQPGRIDAIFVDASERKGVRMNTTERRDNLAVMEFRYLIGTPHGFESHTETHELALFTWSEYADAFEAAGLEPTIDKDGPMGRGLVTGRLRHDPTVSV